MKRPVTFVVAIAVISVIGLAGYLGANSNRKSIPAAPNAPATIAVTRGNVERTVIGPGQVVNTSETVLSLRVGGTLRTINVRPGDTITAGQSLAAIDTFELTRAAQESYSQYLIAQAEYSQTLKRPTPADVAALNASLASAQASYSDLFKPPSDNTVAGLHAALLNAEATVRRAQSAYDRAFASNPAGIGGAPEGLQLETATNNYNAAKAAYDRPFEKPIPGDVQSALARISDAQARLAALAPVSETIALAQAQFDKAVLDWQQAVASTRMGELIAAANGIVLQVNARTGETVHAGDAIIIVVDPKALEVKASVSEEDLPLVHEGQEVQLYFDAAPDTQVTGHVSRIVPKRLDGDRPLYPVYIRLDNTPDGLAAGMSADSAVSIAKQTNVLRLPRATVSTGTGDTAQVDVWANGQREHRKASIGLRGDTYIEIIDGLREGELVVGQ